jgi:triphosphoribosyl-dephospho-CoA synthetase
MSEERPRVSGIPPRTPVDPSDVVALCAQIDRLRARLATAERERDQALARAPTPEAASADLRRDVALLRATLDAEAEGAQAVLVRFQDLLRVIRDAGVESQRLRVALRELVAVHAAGSQPGEAHWSLARESLAGAQAWDQAIAMAGQCVYELATRAAERRRLVDRPEARAPREA